MSFTLTRNDNSFSFVFDFVQEFTPDGDKSTTNISPPGVSPENSFLTQFSGKTVRYVLSGYLLDTGLDYSQGSGPTGVFPNDEVVGRDDQVRYLRDYLHSEALGVGWVLTGPTLPSSGVPCSFDRFRAVLNVGRINRADFTIELTVGGVL